MTIQNLTRLNSTPRVASSSPLNGASPLPAAQGPSERVELSGQTLAPPSKSAPDVRIPTGSEQKWLPRVLAGVGLGLVALSLAGCTGGGEAPVAPPAQQQEKPGQPAEAKTYAQRLEQLRGQTDKAGYYQMVDAGYQKAVLEKFAQLTDPASKSVQELAQKGLEVFNFNGDPVTQQKAMREVMQAISKLPSEASAVARYSQAAKGVLKASDTFQSGAAQASGGIVGQLKSRAYEEGMKAALQQLRQAPATVSGYDPGVIKDYVESLAIGPEVALEFGAQLGDPGVSAVLYQSTSDALYQRVKGDGQILGGQVTAAIELVQNLRKQFGF